MKMNHSTHQLHQQIPSIENFRAVQFREKGSLEKRGCRGLFRRARRAGSIKSRHPLAGVQYRVFASQENWPAAGSKGPSGNFAIAQKTNYRGHVHAGETFAGVHFVIRQLGYRFVFFRRTPSQLNFGDCYAIREHDRRI